MENTPKLLMEEIVRIADSKKARDIVVMKVDDKTTLTDYFVIMTGTSSTHIRALGDEIEAKTKEDLALAPHHGRASPPAGSCWTIPAWWSTSSSRRPGSSMPWNACGAMGPASTLRI